MFRFSRLGSATERLHMITDTRKKPALTLLTRLMILSLLLTSDHDSESIFADHRLTVFKGILQCRGNRGSQQTAIAIYRSIL